MGGQATEQQLSDRMTAAQRGDAAAYKALLRDCIPRIAAIASSQGLSGDLVDDVVQDTLLTVHRARTTYDPGRPFLPWLNAIAYRRAIDVQRRYGRQHAHEIHDRVGYEGHADSTRSAGDTIEQSERARQLTDAIATLPQGQREAIEHLGLQEKSLEETAVLTGRSKGALKVNLHRALKTLRSKLFGGPAENA